jgi:hypothetical protein
MTTKIDHSKIDERMEFTKFFNSFLKVFDLEEDVVCRGLNISKKTFNRWVSGVSAPHALGRFAIYAALAELVKVPNQEI